jgi:hypothetical protein
MVPLTLEQRVYKEKTLNQLLANQALLEARLGQETRPEVLDSIQEQLEDIEAHVSRLQDELAGNVVFDEPVAEELFKQAARALAKEKFFLAKKHISRLETIEPFYPGLDRLQQEAESGRVSRRTRSIAQGTATSYPGTASPAALGRSDTNQVRAVSSPGPYVNDVGNEEPGKFARFFQLHIVISCLVVTLILCVVFGIGGVSLLEWLIEG